MGDSKAPMTTDDLRLRAGAAGEFSFGLLVVPLDYALSAIEDVGKAERMACARMLIDTAERLAQGRSNQVDRHVADVLHTKAAQILDR